MRTKCPSSACRLLVPKWYLVMRARRDLLRSWLHQSETKQMRCRTSSPAIRYSLHTHWGAVRPIWNTMSTSHHQDWINKKISLNRTLTRGLLIFVLSYYITLHYEMITWPNNDIHRAEQFYFKTSFHTDDRSVEIIFSSLTFQNLNVSVGVLNTIM